MENQSNRNQSSSKQDESSKDRSSQQRPGQSGQQGQSDTQRGSRSSENENR